MDRTADALDNDAPHRSGGFGATITSEALPVDVLKGIVELTRGLAGTPAPETSPLPRRHRRPED